MQSFTHIGHCHFKVLVSFGSFLQFQTHISEWYYDNHQSIRKSHQSLFATKTLLIILNLFVTEVRNLIDAKCQASHYR